MYSYTAFSLLVIISTLKMIIQRRKEVLNMSTFFSEWVFLSDDLHDKVCRAMLVE